VSSSKQLLARHAAVWVDIAEIAKAALEIYEGDSEILEVVYDWINLMKSYGLLWSSESASDEEKRMCWPELKRWASFVRGDLDRHPLWVDVHTADFGKPWYDSCDEDTYRPWNDLLPADADENILVASACFETRSGIQFPGFFCPAGENWDAPIVRVVRGGGTIRLRSMTERNGASPLTLDLLLRPAIFIGAERFDFVGGLRGVSADRRQAFYAAIGKKPEEVFPLRFAAASGLVKGTAAGELRGFYRLVPRHAPEVEL
jgi:hypothetical protein